MAIPRRISIEIACINISRPACPCGLLVARKGGLLSGRALEFAHHVVRFPL